MSAERKAKSGLSVRLYPNQAERTSTTPLASMLVAFLFDRPRFQKFHHGPIRIDHPKRPGVLVSAGSIDMSLSR